MSTAYAAAMIQDAPDGPGVLTPDDDGKFMMWDGSRKQMIMAAIRMTGQANTILRSGGYRIQDSSDGPGVLTAGDDGKALAWDNGTGRFVMTTITSTLAGATDFGGTPGAGTDGYAIIWDDNAGEFTLGTFEAAGAVATHAALADPHTGYLLASGTRTGATAGTQAFANIVRANGGLGVNTDPTLADIRTSKTSTATSSLDTSIFTTLTASPASAPAAGTSYRGMLFQVFTEDNAATSLSNVTLYGALGQVRHDGTGALANMYGLNPGIFVTRASTVTNMSNILTGTSISGAATLTSVRGLQVGTVTNTGGATLTNNYGVVVDAQTVGTNIYGFYGNIAAASGRYNIYMVGAAQNYLAGLTGFGVTVPTAMVHAAASTTARASLCVPHGAAPTSPVNGDIWTDTSAMYVRINGVTKTIAFV